MAFPDPVVRETVDVSLGEKCTVSFHNDEIKSRVGYDAQARGSQISA